VTSRRSQLLEGLGVYASVTLLCALLVRGRSLHPLVAAHGATAVGALFLLAPALAARWRARDLADYGVRLAPLGRSLALALGACVLIFPLFALGFYGYVHGRCAMGAVSGCGGLPPLGRFVARLPAALPSNVAAYGFTQLVGVALPEELFYRGYLQELFCRVWPRPASVGSRRWPVVTGVLALQGLLFALTHVATDGRWTRMSVFFPALLFGWMRGVTGSIVAGALFHAACNVVMATIERSL
jgi:hypothetical protein